MGTWKIRMTRRIIGAISACAVMCAIGGEREIGVAAARAAGDAPPAVPPAGGADAGAAKTTATPDATPAAAGQTSSTAAGVSQIMEWEGNLSQPAGVAAGNPSPTNLISVNLDQVQLQDVVRMFTRISGANIVASPTNLQGTVTVNLQDVSWKPAMEAILDMHGLTLVEKAPASGVYSIVPKPAGAPESFLVSTFNLQYASVSNLMPVLGPLLAPGSSIAPYPSLNTLVVKTTAANLECIRQVVESIDRPRQQVYIETKILELNDDAIKDLGIDWQMLQGYQVNASVGWNVTETRDTKNSHTDTSSQWNKQQNVNTLNEAYDVNGNPIQQQNNNTTVGTGGNTLNINNSVIPTRTIVNTVDQGQNIQQDISAAATKEINDVRTFVLNPQQFSLILSALKQVNGVSIITNPKIIVANEESATIHIGQNEPNIRGTVTPGQLGQANTTTYQLDPLQSYFKFGITLDVTPTVHTESNITVRINPTLSRFVQNKTAPDGNTFPITADKTIKTVFSLESGKTAAIGGLTETDDYDAVSKVPLLGDIPLLGKFFFQHSHKEKNQQETIIFVTVGLANPGGMVQELGLPSDTELARRHLLKQSKLGDVVTKQGDKTNSPAATSGLPDETPREP